jgi:hypothetical protein
VDVALDTLNIDVDELAGALHAHTRMVVRSASGQSGRPGFASAPSATPTI